MEHRVEHLRAKEFSKSLVQDLLNDKTSITTHRKTTGTYISITDSLLSLNQSPLEGRNAAKFSFYTRFMYWTAPLLWNRATFEQIKNSGGLRYFKNYHLLEKLMKYDRLINEIEGEFANHQIRGNTLLTIINQIIDPGYHQAASSYFIWSLDTMSKETMENFFTARLGSLTDKKKEIMQMLNMVVVQKRNLRHNDDRLRRAIELADELISDLKKEYHLK
jgi:hypothetical protein